MRRAIPPSIPQRGKLLRLLHLPNHARHRLRTALMRRESRSPITKKDTRLISQPGVSESVAATYSPTLWCSTIGAAGLNFSVRNGMRWCPGALTATVYLERNKSKAHSRKGFGQLVQVSFDIAVFTLPAYQRGSLPRPYMEVSSWRRLRA